MISSVTEYLGLLKKELAGRDPATIQDALSDAEEYLRTALENRREAHPDLVEADALPSIIEEFGSPEEIAAAYKQIENRIRPAISYSTQANKNRSFYDRFFGIIADPKAWGALLYMLISLVTGIIYFTWAITGLSLSLGLIFLIIGLPFFWLFLLSVQGIALLEGRIVEGLLGMRMPSRSVFMDKNLGWWERLKTLFLGKQTWLSILYMILMLPLGIIYFTIFITLLSVSLGLIASPFLQIAFQYPIIHINSMGYYLPMGVLILLAFLGVILAFSTMHLAKWIGKLQGSFAKFMLVRE
jgi:uncharacterized membrane protein